MILLIVVAENMSISYVLCMSIYNISIYIIE
nr:MAG TPA: hypothetical protein [Caudoviricetes sp.]